MSKNQSGKSKRDPYTIPEATMSQLSEHTSGFLLVALDHNGNLVYEDNFDNETVASSIRFKLLQILSVLHQEDVALLKNHILGSEQHDDDEEDQDNGPV